MDAIKKIHKFKAAVDNATSGTEKRPYKPRPGEYFVPRMGTRRKDGAKQTMKEWFAKKAEEALENQG